jgi:hypothetical protein
MLSGITNIVIHKKSLFHTNETTLYLSHKHLHSFCRNSKREIFADTHFIIVVLCKLNKLLKAPFITLCAMVWRPRLPNPDNGDRAGP